jgi:hypothetical protein
VCCPAAKNPSEKLGFYFSGAKGLSAPGGQDFLSENAAKTQGHADCVFLFCGLLFQ